MTNNVALFFERLNTDPEAQELLKGCVKPEKPEDVLKAYTEFAGKLGISFSEEDLTAYLEEEKLAMENRTEAAAAQIQEVAEDTLEAVAGGKKHYPNCKYTYEDHENCWHNDGCDWVYRSYNGYKCHWDYMDVCDDGATFIQ